MVLSLFYKTGMVFRALISEFKRQKQYLLCAFETSWITPGFLHSFLAFLDPKGVYRLPTEATVFSQCPLETPVGQRGQSLARVGKVDRSVYRT